MHEYALKLDQIRKSFEQGKVDAIGNFGKLGGVDSDGKVDAIKKVAKIETSTIKDQLREASKALEAFMKKLDASGFILAQTLLSLDLFSIKSMLNKKSFNVNKILGIVQKMDERIRQVEEQLEDVNQGD